MQLQLDELARCLNTTSGTVERWVRQGRIPVRKKGNQCIFNSKVLQKWTDENNLSFMMPDTKSKKTPKKETADFLSAVKRGGVLYDIAGDSVEEVLDSAVSKIGCLKTTDEKKALYESLIAREELMSTGIGNGVAIPHPRKPLPYDSIPAFITTCFLKNQINFNAVDKKSVFVMFIITCPTSKSHLYLLSRLSFCLRNDGFIKQLSEIPDSETFYIKVKEFQNRFDSPGYS